jgi:hypothetical protein
VVGPGQPQAGLVQRGGRLAPREAQASGDLAAEGRFHLQFAPGKAEGDAGDYASSFAHCEKGNRLRRAMLRYDPAEI